MQLTLKLFGLILVRLDKGRAEAKSLPTLQRSIPT